MDNISVYHACLNRGGLHLNGSATFSRNFSNYLNCTAWPGCQDNIKITHEIPNIRVLKWLCMLNIRSLHKHIDEVRILLANQCID